MLYTRMDSPVGELLIVSDGTCLTGLYIQIPPEPSWRQEELPLFDTVRAWLTDYFDGKRPDVSMLPLKLSGTPFQQGVWNCLLTIPYGKTCTYGEIAREMATQMGKKAMSAQAVGQAVGHNPISIIVPCHRCVGAGGKMTGYAWGIEKKEWLLAHEARTKEET